MPTVSMDLGCCHSASLSKFTLKWARDKRKRFIIKKLHLLSEDVNTYACVSNINMHKLPLYVNRILDGVLLLL